MAKLYGGRPILTLQTMTNRFPGRNSLIALALREMSPSTRRLILSLPLFNSRFYTSRHGLGTRRHHPRLSLTFKSFLMLIPVKSDCFYWNSRLGSHLMNLTASDTLPRLKVIFFLLKLTFGFTSHEFDGEWYLTGPINLIHSIQHNMPI